MSEKFDNLYNTLKSADLISIFNNKVMIFNEGYGEIDYLELSETEDNHLVLSKPGINIVFDDYEIVTVGENARPHHIVINGSTTLTFPSPKKILDHNNSWFPEVFVTEMEKALENNSEDWFVKYYGQKPKVILDEVKKNLSQVKATATKEEIRKAFIDAANYCMMGYFVLGKE